MGQIYFDVRSNAALMLPVNKMSLHKAWSRFLVKRCGAVHCLSDERITLSIV